MCRARLAGSRLSGDQNHALQAQQVREVAVATLGAQAVRWNQAPSMASEDFACMLEACPGPISG